MNVCFYLCFKNVPFVKKSVLSTLFKRNHVGTSDMRNVPQHVMMQEEICVSHML